MAKWGEGDPRWIVEERADATNVNNWHWTEKNATNWSKEKLKELLVGLEIENNECSVKITEITKCEGEASANNRKAKLIFFYEWVINGEWEGIIKNSENKTIYKGTFDVPNLSEENDPKEVDININMSECKQAKLKDFMRKDGAEKIRAQFAKYIHLLKEEFSQGLILPTKESNSNLKEQEKKPTSTNTKISQANAPAVNIKPGQINGDASKLNTKNLSINDEFKCRINELFQVFTDINMVKAYTQNSNLVYEAQKGGRFLLFDSNITGSFVEIMPNKKIVMKWRNKRWPDEHYSIVTLEFEEQEDCTKLSLNQTGIPHNFIENTEDGWKNFYLNPIKQTFGFGARLF